MLVGRRLAGARRASDQQAREAVERAVARAREAGVQARPDYFHAPTLGQALLRAAAAHDLIVVEAHAHTRATGIVLGETATLLVHRSPIPVLIARDRPLGSGVVAATRARPADRRALTTATHLAARLGAELTVVHDPAARAIVRAAAAPGSSWSAARGAKGCRRSPASASGSHTRHRARCS